MKYNNSSYKKGTEPFFNIVMEGLKEDVDGTFFWDVVAEDAIFEFLYHFPNFTDKFEGRKAYMEWFENYSAELQSADNLKVYRTNNGETVILEYEVHGVIPSTGKKYDNRFCSIVTIKDRKIVHWRDYMDSLSAMLANS